jgi:protein-disulfide isomerase
MYCPARLPLMNAIRQAVGLLVMLTACGLAQAQSITERQADEILKELRAIRQALERQQAPSPQARVPQAPPDGKVSIPFAAGGHSIGRPDAPLVMVEYSDYQCPFCRQYHVSTFDEIKKNYVDSGRVRYINRDFPLAFHENARRAAIAARCAGEQGRFWELRHAMIVNANQLGGQNISKYASDIKLEMSGFQTCLDSGRYTKEVDRDLEEGAQAGVSGTPSFVVGRLVNGRLEGVRMVGAMPYQNFASTLDEALRKIPPR